MAVRNIQPGDCLLVGGAAGAIDAEMERQDWISDVAAAVWGGKHHQAVCEILNGVADIVHQGAPGARDPAPLIEAAEAYVLAQLRLEHGGRPEGDLREAAQAAMLYYEVW